jgi:hypothetical protein
MSNNSFKSNRPETPQPPHDVPPVELAPTDELSLLKKQVATGGHDASKHRARKPDTANHTLSIAKIVIAIATGIVTVAFRNSFRDSGIEKEPELPVFRHDSGDSWDGRIPDEYSNDPNSTSGGRTTHPGIGGQGGASGSRRYNPHTDVKRIMEINERNRKRMEETAARHRHPGTRNPNTYRPPEPSIPGHRRTVTPGGRTGYPSPPSPHRPGFRR